jgi:hypothetical protein
MVLYAMIFVFQFYYEGLFRSYLFPVLLLLFIPCIVLLCAYMYKLPLSVQRTFSFIPYTNISPIAAKDAQDSTEWRLRMWRMLLPQVRTYFFLGKGYAFTADDFYMAEESTKRGYADDVEYSMLVGDYHSGPLSVQIPLGIWGTLALLGLQFYGYRLLYRYCKYGDPDFLGINTMILAVFLSRVAFFWGIYGALPSDIPNFLGLLGLSIGINGIPKSDAETKDSTPLPSDGMPRAGF